MLDPGRLRASAAPAVASSPAAAWISDDAASARWARTSGLVCAHGVHGPAHRAVGHSASPGGDVLVDLVGSRVTPAVATSAPGRRPSRRARRAAWRPPRRRCRPARRSGGVMPTRSFVPSSSCGRLLRTCTCSSPSSSTRAPATRCRARPGGQREQTTIRPDGHHQLVAVPRQVDLGRGSRTAARSRSTAPAELRVIRRTGSSPAGAASGSAPSYSSRPRSASAAHARPARPARYSERHTGSAGERLRPPRPAPSSWAATQPARHVVRALGGEDPVGDDAVDAVAEQRQRRVGAARLGQHDRLRREHEPHAGVRAR